jgi:hypothetical protein
MAYYRKRYKSKLGKRKSVKTGMVKTMKKSKAPPADKVFDKNLSFLLYAPTTPSGAGLIGNGKNTIAAGNFGFKIDLFPGLSPYPNIFTYYRINYIKLRWIPVCVDMQVEDNDVGTSASNISKLTPLIYVKRIYGNETTGDLSFSNEDQCLLDGTRPYKMTKNFSIKFVPNSLTVSQTNRNQLSVVNPAYVVEKKQWYSFQNSDVYFYGIKWLISNTNSDVNEFQYRVVATASLSFKGQNDTLVSSISGNSFTIETPIST